MEKHKQLVPKRRFEEFKNKESWLVRELSDYTDVRDGTHDSPKYQDQGHPFVTSKNVSRGFINYEDIEYISTEDFNKINKRSKVDKNDILMGMIGTIGNIALVREEPDYAIKNVALIKESDRINYLYLYYFLQSPSAKKQLDDAMDGGTQKFIALNRIRSLNIKIPPKKEQYRIGCFFEEIDKMIQVQQSKVNKVNNIKNAYLSDIFPKEGEKYPKKRFEGFTQDWKQHKLGDILNYEQPTKYIVTNDTYKDSYVTPVLTAGKSFLLGYTNEKHGIYNVNEDTGVIIFDDFTTSSHFVDFNFKVKSSAMKFLTLSHESNNLYFIYNLVNTLGYTPENHERHWISIYAEFDVLVPDKKEQNKIASFFKNLDAQIDLEEQKLNKLEQLKQAYLNELFV